MQDLINACQLDLDQYRKQSGGRDPDAETVATAHEALRANRVQGVKTHAELMDNALDALEARFNIRRRGRGLDESRGQAVDDRISRQAAIQSRPRVRWNSETSDSSPLTPSDASVEQVTRQYMGRPETADTRPDNRADAVARMIISRRRLRQSVDPAGFVPPRGK
jgi:hypothetical protein